jgi:hypothetical protein
MFSTELSSIGRFVMSKLIAIVGIGTLVVLLGIIPLGSRSAFVSGADEDSAWRPFLSQGDFDKLVESEVKMIQDELKKPKADAHKIRGSAILIALAAQNNKETSDPKQVVTIRETALKLFAGADKPKEAKTLADSLANFKQLKADPQAKTGPVDWRKQIEDLKDAMDIFGLPNKGGEGIEKEYLILGQQRKPFSAAQLSDKLVMMAYKTALIAEAAKAHEDAGQNKKKEWLHLSDDMRRAAVDLAETTKAKKPKEVKTALNKLNTSCNDCHAAFRDK